MEKLRFTPVAALVAALSAASPSTAQPAAHDTVWTAPVPGGPTSERYAGRASLSAGFVAVDGGSLPTVGLHVSQVGAGPGVELVLTTLPTVLKEGLIVVGMDVNMTGRLPERGTFVRPWIGPSLIAGLASGGGGGGVIGANAGLAMGRIEPYGIGMRVGMGLRAYIPMKRPILHGTLSVLLP